MYATFSFFARIATQSAGQARAIQMSPDANAFCISVSDDQNNRTRCFFDASSFFDCSSSEADWSYGFLKPR